MKKWGLIFWGKVQNGIRSTPFYRCFQCANFDIPHGHHVFCMRFWPTDTDSHAVSHFMELCPLVYDAVMMMQWWWWRSCGGCGDTGWYDLSRCMCHIFSHTIWKEMPLGLWCNNDDAVMIIISWWCSIDDSVIMIQWWWWCSCGGLGWSGSGKNSLAHPARVRHPFIVKYTAPTLKGDLNFP